MVDRTDGLVEGIPGMIANKGLLERRFVFSLWGVSMPRADATEDCGDSGSTQPAIF
jgi:hypothetical protein